MSGAGSYRVSWSGTGQYNGPYSTLNAAIRERDSSNAYDMQHRQGGPKAVVVEYIGDGEWRVMRPQPKQNYRARRDPRRRARPSRFRKQGRRHHTQPKFQVVYTHAGVPGGRATSPVSRAQAEAWAHSPKLAGKNPRVVPYRKQRSASHYSGPPRSRFSPTRTQWPDWMVLESVHLHHGFTPQARERAFKLGKHGYIDMTGTWKLTAKGLRLMRLGKARGKLRRR
jgi:hypothetical protein